MYALVWGFGNSLVVTSMISQSEDSLIAKLFECGIEYSSGDGWTFVDPDQWDTVSALAKGGDLYATGDLHVRVIKIALDTPFSPVNND